MNTLFNRKNLILTLALPLFLSACGGKASSSVDSGEKSISNEAGFTALTAGLKAYVAHDKIGFGYTRPSANKGLNNDFEMTYTPVEQPASSSSSASASSSSTASSAVTAGADYAQSSSSPSINFSDPFTLGYSSNNAMGDYPITGFLNGLKDSVGDDLLGLLSFDYPSFSIKQGTSSATILTVPAIKTYLDVNSVYLDLSGASSLVSAINSAVRSTKGNENWSFPSDGYGKKSLDGKIVSGLKYFLPLNQYLPTLVDDFVVTLKDDAKDENLLGTSFSQTGSTYAMKQSVTSFKGFYSALTTILKKVVSAKGTVLEQATEWSLLDNNILQPLKKYGDCLDTFNFDSVVTFSETNVDKIDFSFNASANLAKLKTAYAKENPSGFITKAFGGGTLHALSAADAAIPTPNPALSSYPDIPNLTF